MHTTPCVTWVCQVTAGKAAYDPVCEAFAQGQVRKSTYDRVSDRSRGQVGKKYTTPCVTCASDRLRKKQGKIMAGVVVPSLVDICEYDGTDLWITEGLY